MGDIDRLLGELADEAASHAELAAPGGEGLCLVVAAALCRVLADEGVPDVYAVCGGYRGSAHWWVRAGTMIVDPTRDQFARHEHENELYEGHDSDLYEAECEYPPGWTDEHIRLEGRRAFFFDDVGDLFAVSLLSRLRWRAAHVRGDAETQSSDQATDRGVG